MTRRDLVVLAADKDMEHALRGLLSRHESLPIRQIVFDIFVHPEHHAACARLTDASDVRAPMRGR